nr:protein mono-ADP-ribosyltransferase PARP14 isoform X2 [Crassostrea gigas]
MVLFTDTYEKMEELEREEDNYKYVSKLLHSTVSSLCNHQKTMAVSDSDFYTSNESKNEAQVCDEKSFFSRSESTPFAKEEIRDNSEKVEKLKEKDDQDIYVPKFFIPLISNRSIVHVVDKEYANVESVNEAQVCVGESFLSKPECLDSESKVMGSMEIERSIASASVSNRLIHSMDVQKYDHNDLSLWEMDKALVTGFHPITTQETLINFIAPAAGVEIIYLVRGVQRDAAILVFADKPDFAKMSKKCKERTLEGYTLFAQMVEKCRTIYVKGINKSITYDLVENFFCNKRKSGGGDVEKVNYHPEDGYCIVYFENSSDARNVAAQEKFTINVKEVQAEMFYPCLGLSQKPTNWEGMPCVLYESNVYVIKFVQTCLPAFIQINEALLKKFVRIKWPKSKSDFGVKLQCTVVLDVENAKGIMKNWKEEAMAEMDRHMKQFVYQLHSILPQAWSSFLARFKAVNIDDQVKVTVYFEKKNHRAIVTGYEENSEALTRTILDLIKTEESKIKNQSQRIMKNIHLDFHQCLKLRNAHCGKKLDFLDIYFKININKKEVNLTGKPTRVNKAVIKMHEYLMNTKSKSLIISKGRYKIMKEVKELFIAEMKAKGNKAVWNMTEDKVEMTSSNSEMADEALEIFKEFIPEERIKMKDLVKILTMHDWQTCEKELKHKHNERLNISSSSSEVCVTATKEIFENVCKQIEHVMKICFEKCHIDHRVVKLSKQQFRQLQCFGQNKISQITNAIQKCNSEKGREAMKKVEREELCISSNKEELQYIKELKEVESFKGMRRTSHYSPLIIAECELQCDDKKFYVMKGDVTKLKVDVIVSAANGDLDHCGGLALAISRAGGKAIQEESRRYIMSYGTVPDGEAILAQPGELPCKMLIHAVGPKWSGGSLDEEYLLSAAIFKCLELTDKYKYSSIAIPALSAGYFGCPAEKSAMSILRAIELYMKYVFSSIKEIYFCDVDDIIVKEFVKCLKKKFGLQVKELSGVEHVQQSPVQYAYSDLEEDTPRRIRSKSDYSNCEIKVISGNLAKMKFDVIVSSTDKSLNLTLGATSKSLLRAGGESLQEECTMKYKNGVQPGEVAMIKGGNLHCKQVYYGAIKKWDHNKGDALIKFAKFVDNCLQFAHNNWMSSMAFPALGTGRLGYPPALAAKTMFKCCRYFLRHNSLTTLKEITIVVYHEDIETFQIFRSVLSSEDMKRRTETSS